MVYTGTANTIKYRRIPSLGFRESNEYRGHFFMSIYTVKEIHSKNWVELPID